MTGSFVLSDYDFLLPETAIAQEPLEPRHASRLLHLRRAGAPVPGQPVAEGEPHLSHHTVRDLPGLLPRGALLVVNDTRVVPARLHASKTSGGLVELLLMRPFGADGAGLAGQPVLFKASKGLRVGQVLQVQSHAGSAPHPDATATVVRVGEGGQAVLDFHGPRDLTELLAQCGHVPLPPYIRGGRETPGVDRARYQCTYAAQPGAVAAPTAGLHLSGTVLGELDAAGIERCAVTLHVGPGTFLPVRTDDLRDHRVLAERYELTPETAERLNAALRDRRPIVAVGTTTTRALESAALHAGHGQPLQAGAGLADLTILPGHRFAVVGGLLTNFHLPRSSLLVLVSAFAGREAVLAAYEAAVAAGYRFYSYGDAMLIT